MIKIFLLLFIVSSFLNAADSTAFSDKQELLMRVKIIIQEEESIARAYESFIINEKKLPVDFDALKTVDYLGTAFSLTPFVNGNSVSISDFDFRKVINNRLKGTTYENDQSVKAIYESDLFRKKTFYYDSDTIGIKLDDEFANHLYFLSSTAGFNLIECGDSPKKKYCWGEEDTTDENNIYIYKEDSQTTLLMYYSIDKFKTGPIIITNDTSLHITNDEFNSIPRGALLYDTEAVKYIRTQDSIEVVK